MSKKEPHMNTKMASLSTVEKNHTSLTNSVRALATTSHPVQITSAKERLANTVNSTDAQNSSLIGKCLAQTRYQRTLSVEEICLKQENDLDLARETIKKLQAHIGTIIVSEDESNFQDSEGEEEDIVAEVNQKDAFFASDYTYKTNVNNLSYFFQLRKYFNIFFFHFRLSATDTT